MAFNIYNPATGQWGGEDHGDDGSKIINDIGHAILPTIPIVRGIFDHIKKDDGGPAPAMPAGDDRLKQIRADQQKQADEFATNAPSLKNQIYSDVQHKARQNLAGDLASSRQNYNNRGLLFSGIRQGTDMGLQSQESQGLAKAKTGISTNIDAQARQMQYNAIDSGLQAQKSQQAIQDEIYGNAMNQMQMRNQGIAGIASGAAQIGGAYFARKGQNGSNN